ncbi:MAG: ABC transporter permease [Candidatus Limnocylindrales bacterium]
MILLIRWLYGQLTAGRAAQPQASPMVERPHLASTPARAQGGPLALVLHQARYELLSFLRNSQARFFTLLLPLLFLVIFVTMFGNNTVGAQHVREATYFVPGIAAMGVISASFTNLVLSLIAERESGVLKRRRATPVPAWVLIAGRTLTAMAVSLAVMALLLLVGRVAYGVDLPTASLPAVAITGLAGAATFSILGYALASVIGSADAAQPMVQAITLPLYFISGVFVPNASMPSWLQSIGQAFPVEHLADGLHTALNPLVQGTTIPWGDLGVLAIWAAFGLLVAVRRFSWVPVGKA